MTTQTKAPPTAWERARAEDATRDPSEWRKTRDANGRTVWERVRR